jgi:LacI family transcriptional regulator
VHSVRAGGRTGQIGVLVPVIYDLYFSALLSGAAQAAYEHALRLVVASTLHDRAREIALRERLMDGSTDGTVMILPEASTAELEGALAVRHPFVVLDPLLPLALRIPCVTSAHRSGAEQAMAHLLGLGHRRIAVIAGPPGWLATEERRGGYRGALAAAGIPWEAELETEADFEIGPGAEAAGALLDLPRPPTAIFAFNDALAIGALQAARARGVGVPDQLSIVGYDDIKSTTVVVPSLTTIRQPLAEMGRTAVNLLMRLLDGSTGETVQFELATRLVVRDSTGAPKHGRSTP